MKTILGLIVLLAFSLPSYSRTKPLCWDSLKAKTKLVLHGDVIAAEAIEHSEEGSTQIKLTVSVIDVLYSKNKDGVIKSKEQTEIYLTSRQNVTPVGTSGIYFLHDDQGWVSIDYQNGAWPLIPIRTGTPGTIGAEIHYVVNFKGMYICDLPLDLKLELFEWTWDRENDLEVLTKNHYLEINKIKANLALFLE
ncbi:hypothetical protein QWY77_13625 [Thalassotalea ponticola]|uniref:hypothetical protein n=1 Tax=Thalassotalea ponticola TaxID=1523392 RepID=UPI0025B40B6B|nr:hypothetical protein [Thalassotalea ponticola]MDN3653780.1 hypothetical protein [Thalassotalea ponticola]